MIKEVVELNEWCDEKFNPSKNRSLAGFVLQLDSSSAANNIITSRDVQISSLFISL